MIIIKAFKHFLKRNCIDSATILSFATVVSLVPILFLSMSVFSISNYFDGYKDIAMEFLFNQLLPDSYKIVEHYINEFIKQTANLTTPSFIFLLFVAIFLLFEIDTKVNYIWDNKKKRGLLKRFSSYLLILFLGPFFLITSLIVSSYVMAIDFFGLKSILNYLVPFLLSSIGFIFIYYILPINEISFSSAIKGGIIASLLFELSKSLIVLYIKFFNTYEIMYGTFAALPLLILWIHISWMVLLYGASLVYYFNKK